MPFRLAPMCLLVCLAAPAIAAERPASLVRLPEPAGLARLVLPDTPAPPPLVIILPDALGEDGRSEAYVDALLLRGIGSLVLGLGEDSDAGFEPAHIGLMGFGLGGRAALMADADGLPVASLYPGCPGLPARAGTSLILQGAKERGGCEAVEQLAGVTLHLFPGAWHGWDALGAVSPFAGPMLPDPFGAGRLRARPDRTVTQEASAMIGAWFEEQLLAPAHSAAR